MPLNYDAFFNGEIKWFELAEGLTAAELAEETNRIYDLYRELLDGADDAQMSFEPDDPDANDPYAASEEEKHIGWTAGHLVAHVTASAEEGAVFGSILARGVELGGRIRAEVDWREIDTVEKARHRLEESRRMVLAYLSTWPDTPNLTVIRQFSSEKASAYFGQMNAPAAHMLGLTHMVGHFDQFKDALQQAEAALQSAE